MVLLAELVAFQLEEAEARERRDAELRLAEETAAFRERFIAILGHNLRTPLTSVSLLAQTLLQLPERAAQQERIASEILASTDRMVRMVSDLADLARTRLGSGLPLAPQSLDVESIARQMIGELQAVHPSRVFRLAATGSTRGNWDAPRLAQALSNLIENALAHGDPDLPVEIVLCDDGDLQRIEVRNGGIPIPVEQQATLFDPFRRGVATTGGATHGEGLGLGLYIVDQIVRAHGGEVEVRSGQVEGTCFAVRLPRGGAQPG